LSEAKVRIEKTIASIFLSLNKIFWTKVQKLWRDIFSAFLSLKVGAIGFYKRA